MFADGGARSDVKDDNCACISACDVRVGVCVCVCVKFSTECLSVTTDWDQR